VVEDVLVVVVGSKQKSNQSQTKVGPTEGEEKVTLITIRIPQ